VGNSQFLERMHGSLIGAMNHQDLLDKLIRIERAIGVESNLAVHKMLIEAEDCLLELAKERAESLSRDAAQPLLDEHAAPEIDPCLPGVLFTGRAKRLLEMMSSIEQGIVVKAKDPESSGDVVEPVGETDSAQSRA
jgi:hypothetical protein